MQSKLYLLLVILSIFVLCSISTEQKPRKNDSPLDSKKKVGAYDKEDNRPKDKLENYNDDNEVDDYYPSLSSYSDNRYSPLNQGEANYRSSSYADRYSALSPGEGNYRTRSRWPASSPQSSPSFLPQRPLPSPSISFDDILGENDWSRSEYPNTFPSSLPSVSYDSNPMLSGSPACHSLVDPQYPIFADTCGAVPQARYSLPNSFGHRERWNIAQVLTSLVGSSSDPACTRSLRLLLCPVLFPPCPSRHEPPPVLPCQSYCRAVKARCAIPSLDLLPCEALPYSSDLCPTNQAYGSFIPPGAYPSVSQSSPTPSGHAASNYQMSRSFPSLQSLLSSQGFQSMLTPSSLPSASSPSGQPTAPVNPYNGGPYATDSLTATPVDFSSRSYTNDYRQPSIYGPLTRSPTETRPATDVRPSNAARPATAGRPSAMSSVVKA